ncbi:M23 family metallopeptidase [Polyangium jinanense]|uniref:M23 family metallopeptidase n=1 Tax=Polyangium jinanense TaxID=2829994 RepID=A0A9X3X6Q2_9BACT|nr:M23 family metallopeptidase [Polyangium jinanense]MDC3955864.1 M23 family metallopeptidase [Polyangium jinanense]MDC3983223.1 M23 family metallopeptidase [Polyangium jinanense]MDC3985197.1 M23 family metallopeptidase [Polyangium jinanense]
MPRDDFRIINRLFAVLFATLAVAGSGACSQIDESVPAEDVHSYHDSELGFSLQVPAGWKLPDEQPMGIGTTVSFRDPNSTAKIEIGVHTASFKPNDTLASWTRKYEKASAVYGPGETSTTLETGFRVSGEDALLMTGTTPEISYRMVNIRRGDAIWFVWSNLPESDAALFDRAVASFTFDETSPRTLAEVYGPDFRALDLDAYDSSGVLAIKAPTSATNLVGTYRLPFVGTSAISTGPGCSATHQGSHYEAIDYMLSDNFPVRAAYSGWVSFFGWNNEGFGNLLKINHQNSEESFYAHLNGWAGTMWNGQARSTGCTVAYAGCTGNCSGTHVHFEVRVNSVAASIRNLPGNVWYTSANPPCVTNSTDGSGTGPSSPCP